MLLKIKELRKLKKLNQKEFSDRIGIDNSQLSKIEQGKLNPTLAQLLEISSIFDVSLDWLVGKESEVKQESNQQLSPINDKYVQLLEEKIKDKEAIIKEKDKNTRLLEEKIKQLEAQLSARSSIPTSVSYTSYTQPPAL